MKRTFIVSGLKPAMGKQVNDLMKAFDLGTEGAFVPFQDKLIATLSSDVNQEQLDRQPGAIKMLYEKEGYKSIVVKVE